MFSFPKDGIPILFYMKDHSPCTNWVHRSLLWPRTLKEWYAYFAELRAPAFPTPIAPPPYIPNTVPSAWYHCDAAADLLEAWFRAHQAVRLQMKRLLLAVRRRIMDRRLIGERDVGTLETVGVPYRVEVYDWSTKSKYRFHANTIHRHLLACLRHQSLGIALPKFPTNPYTNLAWTVRQLYVLVDQIQRCFWRGSRFMDPAVQMFSSSGFCLLRFRVNYPQLDAECARLFFTDPTSACWDGVYHETLHDIMVMLHVPLEKARLIRNLVVDRSLCHRLLQRWDILVYQFWCHENLNQLVGRNMTSILDMVAEARKLFYETDAYIRMKKAKRIAPLRNGERGSE